MRLTYSILSFLLLTACAEPYTLTDADFQAAQQACLHFKGFDRMFARTKHVYCKDGTRLVLPNTPKSAAPSAYRIT